MVDDETLLVNTFELLFVMRTEAIMFGLAALVYLIVTFGGKSPVFTKRSPKHGFKKVAETRSIVTSAGGSKGQGRGKRDVAVSAGLDVSQVTKEVRAFGKGGKLKDAVAVFDALKRSGSSLTTLCYNSMLEACVQCGDMSLAAEYFAESRELALADVVTFNLVIKGYLNSGDPCAAWQLLPDMVEDGISPTHVTYHSFLHMRVQAGDSQGAWDCITQMRSKGLPPTSVTCSIMLKLASNPATEADMPRVLSLLEDVETTLDDVLLTSVVEACLKTQRLDLLKGLLHKWQDNGYQLHLSAPAYGSMIKTFGSNGDIDRVWLLWREMKRCKVQPSEVTLGCMVEALVTNGSVDGAWQLVQELWNEESQRHLVNTVIYSTILKGFAMARRLDKAHALYDEMQSRGISCNTIAYNTMLNAFVRCGDMTHVPQILEDMKASSPPVEADMITYSTIIKGYCSSGDLDKGLALVKDMEIGGSFTPDEVMYNSLLDGCAKQKRLEDALGLLKKMREAGVAPSNYTLSIMIKLLGRAKRLSQAFAMLQDMTSEQGFRPNIQVYTCLMQACVQNRQLGKALAIHGQCVDENCKFDRLAYECLLRGCIQCCAFEKAAEVVRCAMGLPGHSLPVAEGPAPGVDSRCIQEVLKKLKLSGSGAVAEKLVSALEKDGHCRKGSGGSHAVTELKSTAPPWRRPVVSPFGGDENNGAVSHGGDRCAPWWLPRKPGRTTPQC
eukprot:TRINITY_DN3490_c0_g5_i1.p1 TRINITY_DN3490_c0_g5~~TRINITY_DN3490_c0_g5_i1.p1  ORF type:complete len:768 (+),score=127.25 TRINITY_DN3490_c0_g5_i1:134-2305(+)